MTNAAESDTSPEKKIRDLEKENRKLRKKIKGLKKTMDITSRHGDIVAEELEEKVEASVREIEARIRMISETIPVPIIISRISDGKISYINDHSCHVFGFAHDEFLKQYAPNLYENPADRQIFLKKLSEHGRVSNFEVRLKKKDGKPIWGGLSSQPLNFKNESCVLTVIYDLTERRKAEDEIRSLKEQLDQKEIKYLIFILDEVEYCIEILKVREIIGMMPITAVPNRPAYVKGVINLRGRVVPVTDLRLRLGLKNTAYTDRTCIIITESGDREHNTVTGIIVDAVSDVRGVRVGDIESLSALNFRPDSSLISGIIRSEGDVKILISSGYL